MDLIFPHTRAGLKSGRVDSLPGQLRATPNPFRGRGRLGHGLAVPGVGAAHQPPGERLRGAPGGRRGAADLWAHGPEAAPWGEKKTLFQSIRCFFVFCFLFGVFFGFCFCVVFSFLRVGKWDVLVVFVWLCLCLMGFGLFVLFVLLFCLFGGWFLFSSPPRSFLGPWLGLSFRVRGSPGISGETSRADPDKAFKCFRLLGRQRFPRSLLVVLGEILRINQHKGIDMFMVFSITSGLLKDPCSFLRKTFN